MFSVSDILGTVLVTNSINDDFSYYANDILYGNNYSFSLMYAIKIYNYNFKSRISWIFKLTINPRWVVKFKKAANLKKKKLFKEKWHINMKGTMNQMIEVWKTLPRVMGATEIL